MLERLSQRPFRGSEVGEDTMRVSQVRPGPGSGVRRDTGAATRNIEALSHDNLQLRQFDGPDRFLKPSRPAALLKKPQKLERERGRGLPETFQRLGPRVTKKFSQQLPRVVALVFEALEPGGGSQSGPLDRPLVAHRNALRGFRRQPALLALTEGATREVFGDSAPLREGQVIADVPVELLAGRVPAPHTG